MRRIGFFLACHHQLFPLQVRLSPRFGIIFATVLGILHLHSKTIGALNLYLITSTRILGMFATSVVPQALKAI